MLRTCKRRKTAFCPLDGQELACAESEDDQPGQRIQCHGVEHLLQRRGVGEQ